MRIRINEWEDNSKNFVITKAYNTILEKIRSIDCVAVTGSSGSGKSATVRQVSLTLCRDDGFEIITISTPVELKTYYTPGRKTMFVLEDLCGKFTANEGQINGWDLMKDVVDQVIKDSSCKLLFSCRLQVFHDPKFSMLQLFKSCECNLISDELCLDTDEKKKIFKSYFGSETTEDDILLSSNVNYPLLCQQMSIRKDNPDVAKYFKTPYCAYKTELEELTTHAPLKICGLCLCIMFNNQLKERDFKILSSDFKTVVNDICEFFGLQPTPATSIRKELDIPDKTFVNKQDGVYKICHDNLFDFMAYYFGTLIPKCFIDHADSSFLRERFLWEKNIQSDKSSIENIVHLDDDFLVLYIDRLISDWLKGKVSDVFYNINMKYISFRKEFLKGLKRIDRNKATDLANIKDAFRDDFASGNTPLIISCLYGDVDLMKWLLEHSAKVNVQRDDGASALCMACEKNHEDAVSILLENNAKVNLCTEEGASPLGIACFFHGNSNIIRQLLKRNPDVNEFRLKKNNMTPLFMACKQNFNSAASLLLEHNADHRICLNNGMSALLMACHNQNTDIVRLLLQEGANPDAQKNDGNTPLFSAAAMGLDIITDLLLQNNADIYKYVYSKEYILQAFERAPDSLDRVKKFWVGTGKKYGSPATKKFISDIGTNALDYVFDVVAGSSPLHVACFMGQIKIVEKLIRTMPQVDLKKKQNGITPLFYACEIGHLVIIRSLLEKGADPTSCTGNQCSPLDKAKSNKHADVLLLLNSSHK